MITQDFLSDIVRRAVRLGVTDAEAVGIETTEFNVEVRLGQVEKLQEAASRGIGLRVLYAGRQASCSTSDVSYRAIDELITNAIEMAKHTSVDEAAVLPAREELAGELLDLKLYDPQIVELPTDRKIEMARVCEDAARGFDARITNSEGAACATTISNVSLATSAGFAGEYQGTVCGLMVAPVAKQGEQMQSVLWGDRHRSLQALDPAEDIGKEAARRALRKLGARKVATQEVPIIFESSAAEELLGDFFEAVDGASIFRRASFLVGKLGERIAAPELTIIDDGRMSGAVGSRPFDGEGLASRRTVVVENGVLKSYLLNTYTARKLGLQSTANASRGLAGAPVVGVVFDGGSVVVVGVVVDGSFPSRGQIALGYVEAVSTLYNQQLLRRWLETHGWRGGQVLPVQMDVSVWYNPTLESKNFVVPGMLVIVMMIFPPLLSALLTDALAPGDRTSMQGLADLCMGAMGFLGSALGGVILLRFIHGRRVAAAQLAGETVAPPRGLAGRRWALLPLGLVGGFLDASGGGGWGPVTTSTLMAASRMQPRKIIGTVSGSDCPSNRYVLDSRVPSVQVTFATGPGGRMRISACSSRRATSGSSFDRFSSSAVSWRYVSAFAKTIANDLGLGRRQVQRSLEGLEGDLRAIKTVKEVHREYRFESGWWSSPTEWFLLHEDLRPILAADVAELPVLDRRVDVLPEDLEDLLERDVDLRDQRDARHDPLTEADELPSDQRLGGHDSLTLGRLGRCRHRRGARAGLFLGCCC